MIQWIEEVYVITESMFYPKIEKNRLSRAMSTAVILELESIVITHNTTITSSRKYELM